jgi:hypothetical protein
VKLTLKALALTAFLMTSGCASMLDESDALAVVPYRIDRHDLIVVEASVNEQGPYNFALDTGASISSIFDPLRDDLALDSIPGKRAIVHGAIASGEFDVLHVDQIRIDREIWAQPTIVSLPGATLASAGIRGVLGVDFLRRYAVAFSARDNVVRLYPPHRVANRSYRGWATVPLRAETIGESGAALYFFDVEVDGYEIAAAFDLGAEVNLMNWAGAKSMGVRTGKGRSGRELSGAFDSMPIAARLRSKLVKTANIRWRNESFAIADLNIFSTLDREDSPTAILGVGLFTQRDFIIDFERNRLLVKISMDEVDDPATFAERDSD